MPWSPHCSVSWVLLWYLMSKAYLQVTMTCLHCVSITESAGRESQIARDQISWCPSWLILHNDNSGKAPKYLHCHTLQATLARARRAALAKAQKQEAEEKLSSDHVAEEAARRREGERRRAREDQGGESSGLSY